MFWMLVMSGSPCSMSPSIGRSTIGASEREIDYFAGHAARYGGLTPCGSEPAPSRLVLYIGADSITARACSGTRAPAGRSGDGPVRQDAHPGADHDLRSSLLVSRETIRLGM